MRQDEFPGVRWRGRSRGCDRLAECCTLRGLSTAGINGKYQQDQAVDLLMKGSGDAGRWDRVLLSSTRSASRTLWGLQMALTDLV